MKITHRITLCDECGLEWVKPFWEPRWVSRAAANEIHDDYHRGWKDPEHNEIVESWREWERDRIIDLLDEALIYGEPVVIERDRLIAIIEADE